MKYSEILKLNKEFENSFESKRYDINILSNIVINQIKEIVEYFLRSEGINAHVDLADYDNIVQDSLKYRDSNAVIVFWELCNIIDGFHYKVELLDESQLDEIFEKIKLEINLVIKHLDKTSLVLINKFSSLSFSNYNIRIKKYDDLATKLNIYLEKKIPSNVRLIDIEKVIANIGISNTLDIRYYYSSKALYTVDFFKAYANFIKPFFMSANGKAKKALIFDCDNTLWKGVLGEDGFKNIEMSQKTNDGAIFSEIQSLALALNNHGILIGLCSKNNSEDVEKVIESHPDMQLRNKHITINKINWLDKVTNLKEISQELNIGLESLVFVDDSSFEVNLIKEKLPEITVLQVPKKLFNYPRMLRENLGLFYNISFTDEDKKKIEMYKHQVNRESVKKDFSDIEDYLVSLELKITIIKNDQSIIPRLSQLTQKTNQFNLTTNRYTERDIEHFIKNKDSEVIAFSVSDKFGDSGIAGMCIINYNNKNRSAEIDTFLMSCRVIGRNIEYAFIDWIINMIKKEKVKKIKSQYVKTQKNKQVKEFYDQCLFNLDTSTKSIKNYSLEISNYKSKKIKYVEVIYEPKR